jgi:hypothetical protein
MQHHEHGLEFGYSLSKSFDDVNLILLFMVRPKDNYGLTT